MADNFRHAQYRPNGTQIDDPQKIDDNFVNNVNSATGNWMFVPSLFRLRITGTGVVTMDSRDSLGQITLNSDGPFNAVAATDQIEFPYAGDTAREIRLTFPATMTVEVI